MSRIWSTLPGPCPKEWDLLLSKAASTRSKRQPLRRAQIPRCLNYQDLDPILSCNSGLIPWPKAGIEERLETHSQPIHSYPANGWLTTRDTRFSAIFLRNQQQPMPHCRAELFQGWNPSNLDKDKTSSTVLPKTNSFPQRLSTISSKKMTGHLDQQRGSSLRSRQMEKIRKTFSSNTLR